MARQGEVPIDVPSGLPWRQPGLPWRIAFWVFVLIGAFCGSSVWGWSSLMAAALGLGTIGVLVGTVIWGPLGWAGVPRIASSGVVTGLGVSAAAGLLAASPGPGALVLIALLATHPAMAFCVRLVLEPHSSPRTSKESTRVAEPVTVPDRHTDMTAAPIETVDDATLCEVWCQSYLKLCTAKSRDAAAVIAADRQDYLDEMVRRNPAGMAAWFAAGARPGASPMTFLRRRAADG